MTKNERERNFNTSNALDKQFKRNVIRQQSIFNNEFENARQFNRTLTIKNVEFDVVTNVEYATCDTFNRFYKSMKFEMNDDANYIDIRSYVRNELKNIQMFVETYERDNDIQFDEFAFNDVIFATLQMIAKCIK